MRKNPNPARKERTVVERGYFHTGNSGISISMIEEKENRDWDERDRTFYQHTLQVRHSAFGAGSSFQTPIAGPLMCDYYIGAFERLKARMLADPFYTVGHPFEDYDHRKSNNDSDHIISVANGYNRETVWADEIITGPNSTETRLLGHVYRNRDGKPMWVEAVSNDGAIGSGSDSSGSSNSKYSKDDIGAPASIVRNRKDDILGVTDVEKILLPTIEQVACVLATRANKVGFMSGPSDESVFTGKSIVSSTISIDYPTSKSFITASEIVNMILTSGNISPTCLNYHLFTITENYTPAGPKFDFETMQFDTAWQPAVRKIIVRFAVEEAI